MGVTSPAPLGAPDTPTRPRLRVVGVDESALSTDEGAHPRPGAPTPAAHPSPRRRPPELLWLAVWGPVGALGFAGLVSTALAHLVGAVGVVALYALLTGACVGVYALGGGRR